MHKEESKTFRPETPFDNIESAQEYVSCLLEAAREAQLQIETEIAGTSAPQMSRRKEALQLVGYKLGRLNAHMAAGERLLKDLRKLRRLILEERASLAETATARSIPWGTKGLSRSSRWVSGSAVLVRNSLLFSQSR